MSVGVTSMFVPAETPVILFIEAPKPAPSASSQTVGVMSSKRCIPFLIHLGLHEHLPSLEE